MTCRDRTSEFTATIKSLQSRQGNGIIKSPIHLSANNHHSNFMSIARKIGHDLANTFAKLEKLTILARKKSLFDDKSEDIQQLTLVIKQDIGILNRQIGQLQELAKLQDNHSGRHVQSHSNTVVVSLQTHLATMSNQFKSVLEVRTENMKHQKCRREQFSQPVAVSSSLPPSALSGNLGSVLLMDEAKNDTVPLLSNGGPDVAITMDAVSGDKQRYQQQLQLIDEQDSYIRSRSEAMRNIEQTIVELGTIFQQLAHMVKEQEEMVERIDSNVDDADMSVNAAHTELVKYFQSVTSNRWLMIKIFGVLIFFFIIFIIVIV